jgi:hypothetical protein
MSLLITPRRRGFLVALNSVVRHFGVCVIPVAEISRMESGAREDYEVIHRPGIAPRNAGYFNGLADYASKTADRLRTHYMPNAAGQTPAAHKETV